jgi:hypothetical protein
VKYFIPFLTIFSAAAFAQITITGNDLNNSFAIGNSTTIHEDTTQSSVDIGTTGGGNNWNFSSLQSNYTAELSSIDPLTSTYIAGFPTADFCFYTQALELESWIYSTLNGYFDDLGSASIINGNPSAVFSLQNDPPSHSFMNPMTYNSQWMQTYTQSNYLNGNLIGSSIVSLSVLVDAYGTMTLPGGASYDALRLRESETISGITSVSYTFLAKNGAQVELEATDSNPSSSGTITVNGTSYNVAISTSGVEYISSQPEDYSLRQNYPNPFNPSTKIEYSIPEQSFVQLKVYDILGNEVATLVNEEQTSGTYRANFNADNIASGFYVAQLRAGNTIKTIKMSLLK